MAEPLEVEVVGADRKVWEGRAVNVIARTTEGDVGILSGHASILAVLVACAVEIITEGGGSEIIAVDGGFISVDSNRVSILAQYATLASETDATQAQNQLDHLTPIIESGEATDEQVHRFHLATAQVKVAAKAAERRGVLAEPSRP